MPYYFSAYQSNTLVFSLLSFFKKGSDLFVNYFKKHSFGEYFSLNPYYLLEENTKRYSIVQFIQKSKCFLNNLKIL